MHRTLLFLTVLTAASATSAQPKLIPKPGIEVPPEKRAKLEAQLKELDNSLQRLDGKRDANAVAKLSDSQLKELLTDVIVFQRAVSDALTFNEFFAPKEIDAAESLLKEGLDRAKQLAEGRADWTTATGTVLRGYRSRIDGSVQPYVVIVPVSYTPKASGHYRLDIWFHGRGETLSEVNFLNGLRTKPGQFTPPDTLVLHPYGRYCNAFKFAGETDVFEALEAARANYRVDDDRTSVRGFSMGGAATWHFAVHHADRWFAANPGAGFVDTAVYQKIFESGEPEPPWYEQRLWRWYDCPPYARNLYHCPTIAYSGEIDKQKAAADMMAEVLADYDISMAHIIGPKTEHKYHPDAAAEVSRRMASLAKFGRDQVPLSLQFDTQTLKYNRMYWVTIDGMAQHWETASVDAEVLDEGPAIETSNVTDLTMRFEPGESPFDITFPVVVSIDDQEFEVDHPLSDRSWMCQLHRIGQQWHVGRREDAGLHKRHDLQGPIDDAFMEAFIFVEPTGKAANPAVETWARTELDMAKTNWRRYFRGQARTVEDKDVGDEEIASMNLVLWGDPSSNAVLKRIADKLPIRWSKDSIEVDGRSFDAGHHALVMIYPNPLNPSRYVVINSGFTFPVSANASNSLHTPKLPDWAVIDLRTPREGDAPGGVAAADFFGERWELSPARTPGKRQRVAAK